MEKITIKLSTKTIKKKSGKRTIRLYDTNGKLERKR